jgi:exodeoxyribonuclease VII large subunit
VDTTLTDLVADVRAATPSEAAELVVPDQSERLARLQLLQRRLGRAMRGRLSEDRGAQRALRARLSDPRFVIAQHQQGLDERLLRAERALGRRLGSAATRRDGLERRLLSRHPRLGVLAARAALDPLASRLAALMEHRLLRTHALVGPLTGRLAPAARNRLRRERQQLESDVLRLNALSPLTVLARGYAVVMDERGRALTRSTAVELGDSVRVLLHQGSLGATVTERVAPPDEGLEGPGEEVQS